MGTHTGQAQSTHSATVGVAGLSADYEAYDDRTLSWAAWLIAICALLTLAFGVVILVEPSITLNTLAVLVGIYLLFHGAIDLGWAIFGHRDNRGVTAVFGIISALLGVFLIRHPTHAVTAIALLIGLWLLAAGLIRLVRTFTEPGKRVWSFIAAVAEIALGVVIVSDPSIGVATLALIIGIALIVQAIALALLAAAIWTAKHAAREAAGTAGA